MRKLLRFKHLKELGIVGNWVQLGRMIKDQGFPPGFLLAPNSRAWTEDEIEAHVEKLRAADRDAPDKFAAESEDEEARDAQARAAEAVA